MRIRPRPKRRGAAALELAIVLPVLLFLTVAAADFARAFYCSSVVANCARNAAFYLSDPLARAESPYTSLEQAALVDAGDLSPAPTYSSATGTDAAGNAYVEATVSYTFQTLGTYPGIPGSTTITRTVRVLAAPPVPN